MRNDLIDLKYIRIPMHEYIRINDKEKRYSLSDALYIPYHRNIYTFQRAYKLCFAKHIYKTIYILTCSVVCQTKAHHIVVPFVMESPLFNTLI